MRPKQLDDTETAERPETMSSEPGGAQNTLLLGIARHMYMCYYWSSEKKVSAENASKTLVRFICFVALYRYTKATVYRMANLRNIPLRFIFFNTLRDCALPPL